ncbi:MAG: TetR family transcriptional regulator [Propionivibrio sp.]
MVRKTKADAEQTRQLLIAAAREMFHRCGVSRTSLEKIAAQAGVTRGAVYWHFANKAELFFAVREENQQMLENAVALLNDPMIDDPLDAIERSLQEFFSILASNVLVQQTFEIMSLRCEYVDEFATVLAEINKPCFDLLTKLNVLYTRAAEKGLLRSGLDPESLAYDTLSFITGAFHNWLSTEPGDVLRTRVLAMIRSHMMLRRAL